MMLITARDLPFDDNLEDPRHDLTDTPGFQALATRQSR